MSDTGEMTLAVQACREAARKANRDIPVAASMAFDPSKQGGFRTNMGVSPSAAAEAMVAAGADIIGANCGSVTPEQMAEIVREFRSVTKQHPILAQPNAGVPELQAGQTVFRLAPEAFAAGMLKVRAAGAQLVGGCCGTTPEHIRCLRQAL
jgi:5-methyltetrahydrofolate--homocysteine methyltransferase